MAESISLPETAPVMPLPGALLFPHALLPLHIFEPRYREMLARALAAERVFCVSLVKPPRRDWQSVDHFCDVATIGLIRASVERADGTSNLILQGLQRVRFTSFVQDKPFPIAQIELIESDPPTSEAESDALARKILGMYEKLKTSAQHFPEKVDRYLSDLEDPEMLADLMGATFINDAVRRQRLPEERAVTERLRLVLQFLREETDYSTA
jgi:Lon protease-like protein